MKSTFFIAFFSADVDVQGRLFSARDFDEGDVVGRWRCGGGTTRSRYIFFGLLDNDFFKDWSGSMVDGVLVVVMVVVVVVVVVVAVTMVGEEGVLEDDATLTKSDHRL